MGIKFERIAGEYDAYRDSKLEEYFGDKEQVVCERCGRSVVGLVSCRVYCEGESILVCDDCYGELP